MLTYPPAVINLFKLKQHPVLAVLSLLFLAECTLHTHYQPMELRQLGELRYSAHWLKQVFLFFSSNKNSRIVDSGMKICHCES
mmetsp:Transcript_8679/g.18699  ORF Transcript_8679/g.18699 Transcript_8679/m.18699 type:complete len:83 (+) Transcript_8679:744-992(+)